MQQSVPPPSADPEEMRRFERLADTWWDADGPFWPLHRLNALRAGYLRDELARHFGREPRRDAPLSGLQVLDIGCGGGILSESMARLGADVTGIDVVERNVAIAARHAEQSGLAIDYRAQGVEQLEGGELFDVVLNMEVVEHVVALDPFMTACASRVRPGGVMVIATLNRTLKAWLFAIVGAEYVTNMLPRGTHQYARFIKPSEMARWARVAGLEPRDVSGMRFNPLARSFRIAPPTDLNYIALFQRGE